jgi:hypothetical protein
VRAAEALGRFGIDMTGDMHVRTLKDFADAAAIVGGLSTLRSFTTSTESAALRRRSRVAANAIFSYRLLFLLPGRDSADKLKAEIGAVASSLLLKYWDELPTQIPTVTQRETGRFSLNLIRQFVITILPGACLFAAKRLGLQLNEDVTTTLTAGFHNLGGHHLAQRDRPNH